MTTIRLVQLELKKNYLLKNNLNLSTRPLNGVLTKYQKSIGTKSRDFKDVKIPSLFWLVHEINPQIDKNEPEGNAYHYVVQKIKDNRYPYILHGPFTSETKVKHWFDAEELSTYWQNQDT